MTLEELANQLNALVAGGHGASEVRLRASMGERMMIRTGVDGIAHEIKSGAGGEVKETVLLWGRTA